jgi:small-conductance mechanosensitive channel
VSLLSAQKQRWLRRLLACSIIIVILVTNISVAYPQLSIPTASPTATTPPKLDPKGAPVLLGDDTLFYIQARIASFSPEFRAQVISNRIDTFAKEFSISTDKLKIVDNETAQTADIRVNRRTLVTIADVDAVAAEKTRQELADLYLQKIKESVTNYRDSNSTESLIRGGLYTLVATLGLLISWIAISRSIPVFYRRLRQWREDRRLALRLFGTEILSADRVVDLVSEIIKIVRLATILAIVYLYLNLVLSFFPWTKGLSRILFGYVLLAINTLGNGLLAYLPNLFFLAVIYFFTSYALKIVRFFFVEIEQGNMAFPGFYREWARPTNKLLQFLVIAFAATVAFPYLPGSGTPAFQGISLFLGLLVSLGSSSVVANIFAGVILTYTRAFQIGDRVKIAETIGDIVDKTLFVTHIRTIKNVVVTIPNGTVLSSHVVNYNAAANDPDTPPLILHTTITLGYDVPWRKVHQALIDAALATSQILPEPPPFVFQTSLDDFYVSYEINAYTTSPGIMAKIYGELHQNIQDKCNEVDIEILSPHYRAVRDGNQTTIPANYLPTDYQAPSFRVSRTDDPAQE